MSEPENPYAILPSAANADAYDIDTAIGPGEARMVNQVAVVGILQIVMGVLEMLIGGGLGFFSAFVSTIFKMDANANANPPPDEMIFWMQMMYGAMAVVLILFAILRIISGIRSFWFRGRILTIVSLIGGLVSVFTCYCSPLSIGLAIYGLVVMLNASVAKAYRMAARGVAPADIKRQFNLVNYGVQPPGS